MSDLIVQVDTSGFERVLREEPGRVRRWLGGVTVEVMGDIITSFGTSPPGRTYTRGSVTHVASQPGYPPNTDTGNLVNSISWEWYGELTTRIMVGAEYGLWLEDGTEQIMPRPFVRPAFDRAQGWVERDAAANLGLES